MCTPLRILLFLCFFFCSLFFPYLYLFFFFFCSVVLNTRLVFFFPPSFVLFYENEVIHTRYSIIFFRFVL